MINEMQNWSSKTGHELIMGGAGTGKTTAVIKKLQWVLDNTDDRIIIIGSAVEYDGLIKKYPCKLINPVDKVNPMIPRFDLYSSKVSFEKMNLILSLIQVSGKQLSIIDRCELESVVSELNNNDIPTWSDLLRKLREMKSKFSGVLFQAEQFCNDASDSIINERVIIYDTPSSLSDKEITIWQLISLEDALVKLAKFKNAFGTRVIIDNADEITDSPLMEELYKTGRFYKASISTIIQKINMHEILYTCERYILFGGLARAEIRSETLFNIFKEITFASNDARGSGVMIGKDGIKYLTTY
jgi:hypothetical protein